MMLVMIIIGVLIVGWISTLVFGLRLRYYRTNHRPQPKCDLCNKVVKHLIGVQAQTPYFKHIKGGPMKVPRRPIHKNNYYIPEVELVLTNYEVCVDCFKMLDTMLNEPNGFGILKTGESENDSA